MRDLKYIAVYLRPCRRDLTLAMVLVFLESLLEMIIPVIMTDIVDIGVPDHNIPLILQQGGKMALCALLAWRRPALCPVCRPGGLPLRGRTASGGVQAAPGLRLLQPGPLLRALPGDPHDHRRHRDAERGEQRPSPLVRGPVMLVLGIGLAFLLNRRLALVFVVCSPVLGVILAVIVHKVGPLYQRQQRAVDHVNGFVQESLTAIRAIKAFVRGEFEAEHFADVNRRSWTPPAAPSAGRCSTSRPSRR